MTITAEQLAARRDHIGSSDAAAILGLDPFRSAYDVWLEKTADVEPFAGNEDTDTGDWLERPLCEWAVSRIGAEAVRLSPDTLVAPCGILAANLDAVECATEPTFFIEAKSTKLADDWGDEDTDEVPPRVVTQTAIAFACGPTLRIAWVPVALAKFGLRRKLYRIERDDALVDAVAERCRQFWREHVENRVAPTGVLPNLDLLKRIRREPESCVDLDESGIELVDMLAAATGARKAAEKTEEEAKAALIAALGAAESANLPDGRLVTYLSQTRRGLDARALRLAHPDFVAKYETATTFRTLRIKEPKP